MPTPHRKIIINYYPLYLDWKWHRHCEIIMSSFCIRCLFVYQKVNLHSISTYYAVLVTRTFCEWCSLSLPPENKYIIERYFKFIPGLLLTDPLPFFTSTIQVASFPSGPSFTLKANTPPIFFTSCAPSCKSSSKLKLNCFTGCCFYFTCWTTKHPICLIVKKKRILIIL